MAFTWTVLRGAGHPDILSHDRHIYYECLFNPNVLLTPDNICEMSEIPNGCVTAENIPCWSWIFIGS